jgi:hypothetical protein
MTKQAETTKSAYIVSYRMDADGVCCTNIAIAECRDDVEAEYSGCDFLAINPAKDHEIEALRKRGCPIVECEHTESEPAITFNTAEEYEAQCKRMEEFGIDTAGNKVWEACKADMEGVWVIEDELRACYKREANPEYQRRIRKGNRQARLMLEAYCNALQALGVELTWQLTVFDETEHIHKVTACRRGYVVGCIASY